MTVEQVPTCPRPWFGVLAALAPVNLGCFSFVWDAISNMAPHVDRGVFALVLLFVPPSLGTILAVIALVRGERWRWLGITGLAVNMVLLMLLVLALAGWFVVRNTKVV